ncbi:MAG: hypothetical protein IJO33_02285 [Bacilli bacterium]|nr:hypothetical protein [Bacilli bacterium]
MQDSEKYLYGDEILWDGKIFEIVQVGTGHLKSGEVCPLLYTVQTKYPYEIKIFYEKTFPYGRQYLFELTKTEVYNQIVSGFQQEILKNSQIAPKHKIFEPNERVKYEKEELKGQKKLLAQELKEEKMAKKNKAQELVVQLDYLKKSKEDPINYPPLKFNSTKEAKDYMDYLLANKDKLPPITPEEEAEMAELFKNVSYSFPKSKK